MSAKDLEDLLERVEDTRELVLRSAERAAGEESWRVEELYLAWSAARDEVATAYGAWRERPGRERYLVYLAAEDRADAATAALAREAA
jgi:hypothetical protein